MSSASIPESSSSTLRNHQQSSSAPQLVPPLAATRAAPAPSASAPKRNSKACENCRSRRVKCSGGQPCRACLDLGLGGRCAIRTKARPGRIPKIVSELGGGLPVPLEDSPPYPLSDRIKPTLSSPPGKFVSSVQAAAEHWCTAGGHSLDLSLSDDLPLRALLSDSPAAAAAASTQPVLVAIGEPGDTSQMQKSLLDLTPYVDFISEADISAMLSAYQSDPATLAPDSRALLLAFLGLGSFKTWMHEKLGVPAGEGGDQGEDEGRRDDAVWYKRALAALDEWDGASCTALKALHCLHLLALRTGGIIETRDILQRMSKQVRSLGLHHESLASLYPPEDQVEKLLFTTLYKDSWYATLVDAPPFLSYSEISVDLISGPDDMADLDSGPDRIPFLVQLTVFENDLLTQLHAVSAGDTTASLSHEYILDVERKWERWMRSFREEQARVRRPMMYIYANIRFQWLRLILHFPLLSHPSLSLMSLATVSRSVTHLLSAYLTSTTIQRFTASWADMRRIVTSGQLVLLLYDEHGELLKAEAEGLMGMVFKLLAELGRIYPMARDMTEKFRYMVGLAGLDVSLPDGERAGKLPVDFQPSMSFDYILPASLLDWMPRQRGVATTSTALAGSNVPPTAPGTSSGDMGYSHAFPDPGIGLNGDDNNGAGAVIPDFIQQAPVPLSADLAAPDLDGGNGTAFLQYWDTWNNELEDGWGSTGVGYSWSGM